MINTGCSNNRSAEISADVFNGNIRGAEIRLCTNIKPMGQYRKQAAQAVLYGRHSEESYNQNV